VTPLWRTAEWGYVRLHAGAGGGSGYGAQALTTWARRVREAWPGSQDVYVYFNNDVGGAAVRDAIAFARLAARGGLEVLHPAVRECGPGEVRARPKA
jgi:uncharacterized protein YecE (DUF72 family)